MWRTPQPNPTPRSRRVRPLSMRADDRQRLRLVGMLRSVARTGNIRGRARRYEVLLCERAASVRPQLLEVAATLERLPDPEPDTLEALRSLLTDGCTSPLYNPDVPAQQLYEALGRIGAALSARELGTRDRSPVPLRHRLTLAARHARST